MNDPFFAIVDEAQPVFASKTLQSDEAPKLDKFQSRNNYNNINNNDIIPKRASHNNEFQNRNYDYEQFSSRNNFHHSQNCRKDFHNYQEHKPRLPSMLDDIKGPKPLKINPKKPPESKKFFNIQVPDHYTYAKPYDGV
ncbi:hypothetical protein M9Y10_009909 [Tritrichomonas musculus]|uniref:Uncharacterized protein n=1 Tax=Tritrichomonas musculus TaxID=1915356 RepID=A0ABR2IQT8_9EUKA